MISSPVHSSLVRAARGRALLGWLAEWRFISPSMFASLNRLEPHPRQLTYLRSLTRNALLSEYSNVFAAPSLHLFGIGPAAPHRYPALVPQSALLGRVYATRLLSRPSIHHDLAVLAYVARHSGASIARRPVRVSDVHLVPDALLTEGTKHVALEIELTQKTLPRMYRIFAAHADALAAGAYERVRYVFPSSSLAQVYRARFAATEWPLYAADAARRSYTPTGETVSVPDDHPLRPRFEFLEESPAWPTPIVRRY